MILPSSFYNRNTLQVAQDLLGCFLVRESPHPLPLPRSYRRGRGELFYKKGRRVMRYKIVEVEAYNGPNDLASHASRGQTLRNEVMFGNPGIIYVYFTYGMHYMLNIVTEKKDYPAAVLIRAVEPRHSRVAGQAHKEIITNGPARLTKVLKINKSFSGLPIYIKKYGLWIEGRSQNLKNSQIIKTTRVGVDYAGEYKNKKWRFYIRGNKLVSKK